MGQAEVDARVLRFVEDVGVIRVASVSRLLDVWEGEQKKTTRDVRLSRLVRRSGLTRVHVGRSAGGSILGSPGRGWEKKIVAQLEHELRVSEVAVEFACAGFSWVPPNATGQGASKVSDGVAVLDGVEFHVEVELSAKKQNRWRGIVARYRNLQAVRAVGVVYVMGSEGLRKSFGNVLRESPPPGWWLLGVTDSDDVAERQRSDGEIVRQCVEALDAGAIVSTDGVQQEFVTRPVGDGVTGEESATAAVFDGVGEETEAQRQVRLLEEQLGTKTAIRGERR